MTDEQFRRLNNELVIIRTVPWIGVVALFLIGLRVHAQSGPCEVTPTHLRCYVGPTQSGDRFAVGATPSTSPDRDIGPPWDEATERPDQWYGRDEVVVMIQTTDGTPPRDSGWVMLPLPDVRIEMSYGSGHWVRDEHARVQVHYAPAAIGLCSVSACGARLVLRRADVSLLAMVPTVVQVREIAR